MLIYSLSGQSRVTLPIRLAGNKSRLGCLLPHLTRCLDVSSLTYSNEAVKYLINHAVAVLVVDLLGPLIETRLLLIDNDGLGNIIEY